MVLIGPTLPPACVFFCEGWLGWEQAWDGKHDPADVMFVVCGMCSTTAASVCLWRQQLTSNATDFSRVATNVEPAMHGCNRNIKDMQTRGNTISQPDFIMLRTCILLLEQIGSTR